MFAADRQTRIGVLCNILLIFFQSFLELCNFCSVKPVLLVPNQQIKKIINIFSVCCSISDRNGTVEEVVGAIQRLAQHHQAYQRHLQAAQLSHRCPA